MVVSPSINSSQSKNMSETFPGSVPSRDPRVEGEKIDLWNIFKDPKTGEVYYSRAGSYDRDDRTGQKDPSHELWMRYSGDVEEDDVRDYVRKEQDFLAMSPEDQKLIRELRNPSSEIGKHVERLRGTLRHGEGELK